MKIKKSISLFFLHLLLFFCNTAILGSNRVISNAFRRAKRTKVRKIRIRKNIQIPILNRSRHKLPSYQTNQSSGMDLHAYLDRPVKIAPQERSLIPTGIHIALPSGYEAQVRPRSGLACHAGITVLNNPGTIDSDYRGEIKVLLINLGQNTFQVEDGTRIAQLVIAPYTYAKWSSVKQISATERGGFGFGSTGIK